MRRTCAIRANSEENILYSQEINPPSKSINDTHTHKIECSSMPYCYNGKWIPMKEKRSDFNNFITLTPRKTIFSAFWLSFIRLSVESEIYSIFMHSSIDFNYYFILLMVESVMKTQTTFIPARERVTQVINIPKQQTTMDIRWASEG